MKTQENILTFSSLLYYDKVLIFRDQLKPEETMTLIQRGLSKLDFKKSTIDIKRRRQSNNNTKE